MKKTFIRKVFVSSALAFAAVHVFAQGAARDGWVFNSFENTLETFSSLPGWGMDYYPQAGSPLDTYMKSAGVNVAILGLTSRFPVLTPGGFEGIFKFGWSRSYREPDPKNPIVGVGVGMTIGPGNSFSSSLTIGVSLYNETAEPQDVLFSPYFDPSVATRGEDMSELTNLFENGFEVITVGRRGPLAETVTIRGLGDGLVTAFEVGEAPSLSSFLFSEGYKLAGSLEAFGDTAFAFDYLVSLAPFETKTFELVISINE